MKLYRYYLIGLLGLAFEFLAILSAIYGDIREVIHLICFGLLMIPIGFMVEDLELKIEKLQSRL